MDYKEPSQSTVWIGTSTHSCCKVTIIDANNPSVALDQFIVSSSHLLCIASVPGISSEDAKQEPDISKNDVYLFAFFYYMFFE